jgi:hypothetical protein
MTEQPYFANPLKPLKEKHASVFSLPLTTILKEVNGKKLCLEYVSFFISPVLYGKHPSLFLNKQPSLFQIVACA